MSSSISRVKESSTLSHTFGPLLGSRATLHQFAWADEAGTGFGMFSSLTVGAGSTEFSMLVIGAADGGLVSSSASMHAAGGSGRTTVRGVGPIRDLIVGLVPVIITSRVLVVTHRAVLGFNTGAAVGDRNDIIDWVLCHGFAEGIVFAGVGDKNKSGSIIVGLVAGLFVFRVVETSRAWAW